MSFRQTLRIHLLPLLHTDLVPIVLEYAASIEGIYCRQWGRKGEKEGYFNCPNGMCVYQSPQSSQSSRPPDDRIVPSGGWPRTELFVMDAHNLRVQTFDFDTGRFYRMWSIRNGDRIQWPSAVVVDGEEIFMTDYWTNKIQVFHLRDLHLIREWSDEVSSPIDIRYFDQHVYVSNNSGRYCLTVFTREGKFVKIIGRTGSGKEKQLLDPHRFVIVPIGEQLRFLIADGGSNCVKVWNEKNQFLHEYGDRKNLNAPRGVAVHGSEVVISDAAQVTFFDFSTREFLRTLSVKGNSLPDCCSLLAHQNQLLVCDRNNHRILVFD